MQTTPYTPLANLPWLRWSDRSGVPAFVIGLVTLLLFIPFYRFNALTPQMPLQAGMFPPAFALALTFLLILTRGAYRDLVILVQAGKIDRGHVEALAASVRAGRIEFLVGLLIGLERLYSQVLFGGSIEAGLKELLSPGGLMVAVSIIGYTVVQIHLLAFCVRQVLVFRRVAKEFNVDLMAPELNNALSNPLIRFLMVGLIAISFGVLVYQAIPFASLQTRLLQGSLIAIAAWLILICVSLIPLFILRSRIAVAKSMEISVIRRALAGDFSAVHNSHFGDALRSFTPADLMYYEDRIKLTWDWPIEAHVRRLVLFGLLPPLTWVLAALVEIIFETMLTG